MSAALDEAWPARGSTKARVAAALIAVAVLVLLDFLPGVDLAVSGWFYRPGEGFPLAGLTLFKLVMRGLPILAIGSAMVIGALGVAALFLRRHWIGITPRLSLYIVLSLMIGPGLLVNSLFKDNWGRARPHQILDFGGAAHFTPALELADQCARNCSFPSGHGALGIWMITLAVLAPVRWRQQATMLAIAIGAMVGLMRIAQGAHYLSDVVASVVLVVGVNWTLKYLILGPANRAG